MARRRCWLSLVRLLRRCLPLHRIVFLRVFLQAVPGGMVLFKRGTTKNWTHVCRDPSVSGCSTEQARCQGQEMAGTPFLHGVHRQILQARYLRRWHFPNITVFDRFFVFGTVERLVASLHYAMEVLSREGLVCFSRRFTTFRLLFFFLMVTLLLTSHCSQQSSVSRRLARGIRGLEITKWQLGDRALPQHESSPPFCNSL